MVNLIGLSHLYTRAKIFSACLFQVFAYIKEIHCIQISLIDSNVNLPHITGFYIEFFTYIEFFKQ